MRRDVTVWVEPGDGYRKAVLAVGLRNVSRATGVNASHLSRWLIGRAGISLDKAESVYEQIKTSGVKAP